MPQYLITSPDGTKYNVTAPEGASEQDALKRVMDQHTAAPPEQPGFLGRVKGDVENRFGKMGEEEVRAGLQKREGGVEQAFQQVGQGAGLVGDVAGEAVSSVAKPAYEALPQSARDKISQTVHKVAQSPIGQKAIHAIKSGGEAWGNFSKEHPDVADDLTGAFNIATAGLPVGKTAKAAEEAAPAIAGKIGEGADFVAKGAETVGAGLKARSGEELQQVANTAKNQYSPLFKKMKDMGATFTPKASAELLGNITNDLKEEGIMDKSLHSKTMGILRRMGNEIPKQGLDLEKLDQYRRLLNGVVNDTKVGFKMSEDGTKALKAINSIDSFVNDLDKTHIAKGDPAAVDLLKQARAQWSHGSKLESLSRIVSNAGGSIDKLKSGLNKFISNKKNLRSFSAGEVAALKKAADSSTSEKLLKMLGKFGIDQGHTVVPGLVALGGYAAHSPAGIPLVAAGTGARQLQKFIGQGKMEQALKLIESNAPKSLEALK